MFIISKKNIIIQRPKREPYVIRKGFIGEIPEDVASHWLVQAAVMDGTIATPRGKKDTDLENADQAAEEKEIEFDIRPDVKDHDGKEETEETEKTEPEEKEPEGKTTGKRGSKK